MSYFCDLLMEAVAGSLLHAVCNGRFYRKEMEAGVAQCCSEIYTG